MVKKTFNDALYNELVLSWVGSFFENHRKIIQVINLKNAKYQRVQVRCGEPV